jgi:hypothetical protein
MKVQKEVTIGEPCHISDGELEYSRWNLEDYAEAIYYVLLQLTVFNETNFAPSTYPIDYMLEN